MDCEGDEDIQQKTSSVVCGEISQESDVLSLGRFAMNDMFSKVSMCHLISLFIVVLIQDTFA
jgi:hypothetical protein